MVAGHSILLWSFEKVFLCVWKEGLMALILEPGWCYSDEVLLAVESKKSDYD
jgi:hypothetical protein